jgi:hypothetical protein
MLGLGCSLENGFSDRGEFGAGPDCYGGCSSLSEGFGNREADASGGSDDEYGLVQGCDG